MAIIIRTLVFIVLFFVKSCLEKLFNHLYTLEASRIVIDQHDHRCLPSRRIFYLSVCSIVSCFFSFRSFTRWPMCIVRAYIAIFCKYLAYDVNRLCLLDFSFLRVSKPKIVPILKRMHSGSQMVLFAEHIETNKIVSETANIG